MGGQLLGPMQRGGVKAFLDNNIQQHGPMRGERVGGKGTGVLEPRREALAGDKIVESRLGLLGS
eukprot:1742010-Pyramimonas_sp.AAC.1